MSLNIVCGLTGSGKTYFIIRMIEKELKKLPEDFFVASNTPINLPPEWGRKFLLIHNPKDLLDLERAVVIVDDAGSDRWFSARGWLKLDPRIQDKIINNRKDRLRIWASTQFYDSIDKYLRLNIHHYWEAVKIMGSDEFSKRVWGLHRYKRFHPRMADKIRRRKLQGKWFWLRRKYIDMFDTYAKVTDEKKTDNVLNVFEKLPPPITRETIRENQALIDKHRELVVKRKRGRPRKIKVLTG